MRGERIVRGERNEAARAVVLAQLRAGASVSAAARPAGCARQLVYSWRDRGDEEIAGALRDAAAAKHAPQRTDREVLDEVAAAPPVSPAESPQRAEVLEALRSLALGAAAKDSDRVAAAKAYLAETRPVRPVRAVVAPGAGASATGQPEPVARENEADVEAEVARFKLVPRVVG